MDHIFCLFLRTLQSFFEGLFPRDNPRNTRFAINFFTSIGLGGLTYVPVKSLFLGRLQLLRTNTYWTFFFLSGMSWENIWRTLLRWSWPRIRKWSHLILPPPLHLQTPHLQVPHLTVTAATVTRIRPATQTPPPAMTAPQVSIPFELSVYYLLWLANLLCTKIIYGSGKESDSL